MSARKGSLHAIKVSKKESTLTHLGISRADASLESRTVGNTSWVDYFTFA